MTARWKRNLSNKYTAMEYTASLFQALHQSKKRSITLIRTSVWQYFGPRSKRLLQFVLFGIDLRDVSYTDNAPSEICESFRTGYQLGSLKNKKQKKSCNQKIQKKKEKKKKETGRIVKRALS